MAGEGMRIRARPRADRAEIAAPRRFLLLADVYQAVAEAEALVLVTPWPEYKSLDYARIGKLMSGKLILDTANLLDAARLEEMGFKYLDIGRGRTVS